MANEQNFRRTEYEEHLSRSDQYGLIVNPLEKIEPENLLEDVENFYAAKHLEQVLDLSLLKRGALLAKDPDHIHWRNASAPNNGNGDAASYMTKTDVEEEALEREDNGTLRSLTKELVVIIATCAIGAIVQGWSQESIVGANLNWPVEFGLAAKMKSVLVWHGYNGDEAEIKNAVEGLEPNGLLYFGLVNAMPYFAASALGSWASDPISYAYGRRTALFFAAICSLAAPIGAAYCHTWIQLLMCRLIQGIGMGAKASVVPVLESEVTPPRLRGRLLVSWQTFVAFGIFLGASANCIFNGHWRLQIGIAFIPALLLLCLCYVIPESPRWLMKKGDYAKAYQVFVKLRETPLQAARDFYLIHRQLELVTLLAAKKNIESANLRSYPQQSTGTELEKPSFRRFFLRVPKLFTDRRNRRAVVGSSVAMIAQQFSGINIFAFLATTIFERPEENPMRSLWMTFGFAASNAVFSPMAYFLIDRLGRRTLLLSSLVLMLPFLLLTGHYLDLNKDGTAIALFIIYTAVYSPGAGVVPFMYSSEVFPQLYREVGMSFACTVNFSFAGALAMAVPQYSDELDGSYFKLLGTFAALDALAAIMVWLVMRSPDRAVELEDMNFLFGARSIDYISYQIRHVAFINICRALCLGKGRTKETFEEWQTRRMEEYLEINGSVELMIGAGSMPSIETARLNGP